LLCAPAGKGGCGPKGLPEQPGAGLAGPRVLRGLGWLAALPLEVAAAAAAADAAGECGPSEVALADAAPAALQRAGAALQADAAAAAAEARAWLAVCMAVHGGACAGAHARPRLAVAAGEAAEAPRRRLRAHQRRPLRAPRLPHGVRGRRGALCAWFEPIPASHTDLLKQPWAMRQALAALAALDGRAAALGAQPRVLRTLVGLLTGARPPAWEAPPRPPDKLTAHIAATLKRRARRPTQACVGHSPACCLKRPGSIKHVTGRAGSVRVGRRRATCGDSDMCERCCYGGTL